MLKIKKVLALIAMASVPAFAQAETVAQMFITFSNSYAGILTFIKGLTWLIGLSMAAASIFAWVKVMEGRDRTSLKVPASRFIIGVMLMNLPKSLQTAADTFGMTGGALLTAASGSAGASVGAWSGSAIAAVLGFAQILGYIAFVRGMVILHKFNAGEAKDGLSRAAIHIFGGALAINIKWTVAMLAETFAPSMTSVLQRLGIL